MPRLSRQHLHLLLSCPVAPETRCDRWLAGQEEDGSAATVTISSIHAAKGLEWDTVFVMRCNQGFLPMEHWATSQTEPKPERLAALLPALSHAEVCAAISLIVARPRSLGAL